MRLVFLLPILLAQRSAQEPQDLAVLEVDNAVAGEITGAAPAVHTSTLDSESYAATSPVGVTYRIRVAESGSYHLDLRSHAFDAYLVLRDADGRLLAEDDDGLIGTHSRAVVALEAGVDYRATACALHGARGPFQLRLLAGSPPARNVEHLRAAQVADGLARIAWLERVHGAGSVVVATSLNKLALLYEEHGRFDDAEPLFVRALGIVEQALGPEHTHVATALNNLAGLYRAQGRYAEAEPLYLRAVAIDEKAVGPEHPDVAISLNNLAGLYRVQGRYALAEPLYARVLAIEEKAFGPGHPHVASDLNNLAALYRAQGRHAEAEPLYERALAIREAAFGPGHPAVAASLNNLAALYRAQGRYAEAEPLYERALAIREEALGPEHDAVGGSLNNLASLHEDQGRHAEAEALYLRALAIAERAHGTEHLNVATILNNLAGLYRARGRYAEAEPRYERALAIKEKAHGTEHPDVAISLNNIAVFHTSQGRYRQAELAYERARAIWEEALGPKHPNVAASLNNLAYLYDAQGRYADARPLYERALAIRQQVLEATHPDVAGSLNNLAFHCELTGRYAEAQSLRKQALRGLLAHLDRELPTMTEADRFRLLGLGKGTGPLLATTARLESSDRIEVLELCLQSKGKLSRLQAASLALGQRADDPEVRRSLDELQSLQKRLSRLVFLPEKEQEADHADGLAALRTRRLQVERELNRTLELDAVLATPTSEVVTEALPAGGVLLDFHVDEGVFAWVMRREEPPALVSLGAVQELKLRDRQEAVLAPLVTRGGAGLQAASSGEGLFDLLWAPLAEYVGDAEVVFVSPSGFLCELPFGILRDAEGRYLLEKHRFVYLSDPTRIVAGEAAPLDRPPSALFVGAVDYGDRGTRTDSDERQEFSGHPAHDPAASTLRSPVHGTYTALPGTARELEVLAELHSRSQPAGAALTQLTGADASEENVRAALAGKRFVHVATHGYFEPDALPSLMRDAEAKQSGSPLGEQSRAVGLIPGLLSGFVLAGVNAPPDPARDDGYLSAEELQYLDLSACDVAVLSACETALGSQRAGEGLMSLRRAFEVAGARTVISSLWKVDDAATATLMKWFYENYWVQGMTKSEALHQAKLRMLRQNRADYQGDARPSTWGAFVLSGDWR